MAVYLESPDKEFSVLTMNKNHIPGETYYVEVTTHNCEKKIRKLIAKEYGFDK